MPPLVKTISEALQPSNVGHRFARILDRGARFLPVMVDGRGVAEVLPKIRAHGLEHLGQDRGSGVIVEVNATHTEPASILRDLRVYRADS